MHANMKMNYTTCVFGNKLLAELKHALFLPAEALL